MVTNPYGRRGLIQSVECVKSHFIKHFIIITSRSCNLVVDDSVDISNNYVYLENITVS